MEEGPLLSPPNPSSSLFSYLEGRADVLLSVSLNRVFCKVDPAKCGELGIRFRAIWAENRVEGGNEP